MKRTRAAVEAETEKGRASHAPAATQRPAGRAESTAGPAPTAQPSLPAPHPAGPVPLAALIDVADLQATAENLHAATGSPLAVMDPDGSVIVGAGWQSICTDFHRRRPEALARCVRSDNQINALIPHELPPEGFVLYRCPHRLWDAAFPLIVEGHHLANVFTGQVLLREDADGLPAEAGENADAPPGALVPSRTPSAARPRLPWRTRSASASAARRAATASTRPPIKRRWPRSRCCRAGRSRRSCALLRIGPRRRP